MPPASLRNFLTFGRRLSRHALQLTTLPVRWPPGEEPAYGAAVQSQSARSTAHIDRQKKGRPYLAALFLLSVLRGNFDPANVRAA